MSTESSASETTPLRRPESSLSDEISSSSHNVRLLPPHDRNLQTNLSSGLIQNPLQENQRFNNVNSINNYNRESDKSNMETNKKIIYRIVIDVVVLLCVGFPILIFFLLGTPYKRGFFCDDESLKHPFHDSTVRNWMLYIIGLVIPIGTILLVEILRFHYHTKRSNGNNIKRQYILWDYEIPDWMVECYKKIGVFGFGAAASQLVTDIAKYSIGRLRPHFFYVCQPIMPDGTTCDDPINMGKYILDFNCRGIGSSEKMLKEVRLSFPSGHSSFTFYTMVYLALYLQARWHWKGSKLLRHAIQFCLLLIAWFTALSRVSDYKHHWSDVLAGVIIGVIVAIVVARYVSDLFVEKPAKSYMLPKTQQDLNQQTNTTNGHG